MGHLLSGLRARRPRSGAPASRSLGSGRDGTGARRRAPERPQGSAGHAGSAIQDGDLTLLADVVSASARVADTSSRSRKVAILAALLSRLETGEVPVAVG